MSTPAPPTPRHTFGWPPGSIRAILVLMVVALVCALLLLSYSRVKSPHDLQVPASERVIPIPPYLLYLLFMAVGYYFAARGHSPRVPGVPPPLWLPTGSIRLFIFAALTATLTWRVVTDRDALEAQLTASIQQLAEHPLLPLVVLGGFFVGVVFRVVVIRGHERSYWAQDLEGWFALIAVLLMSIAALIHLVIDPSLGQRLYMPTWEMILAGAVTFYFGLRS